MKALLPTEDAEQIAVVQYLEIKGLRFTAIPNHTYTDSWKQKNHNKALGLHAGLPDLLIVLPGQGLLFIEMKRLKHSYPTEAQLDWIKALNEVPGVAAYVCHGADEAIKIIESYMEQ